MKFNYSFKETQKAKYKLLFASENVFLFLLSATVLFVPIILGHINSLPNQLIVGSIVNFLLASSAMYLSFKKSLPVILLPAIAAVISGAVFGSLTMFLVYLVPFIWIGNALYVYFIKNFNLVNKANYFVSVLGAGIIKSLFLFGSTFVLVSTGIVPAVFLIPMGLLQFVTAILGGFAAKSTVFLKK